MIKHSISLILCNLAHGKDKSEKCFNTDFFARAGKFGTITG
ncbi:hypothetical protein SALWKB2_1269 [Snodgrassella alvi wkB2]|nr:hypothetical protein SALWKB2_1269 [Snodgrassella alvi wkB2]